MWTVAGALIMLGGATAAPAATLRECLLAVRFDVAVNVPGAPDLDRRFERRSRIDAVTRRP
jgi:hypothetical protein